MRGDDGLRITIIIIRFISLISCLLLPTSAFVFVRSGGICCADRLQIVLRAAKKSEDTPTNDDLLAKHSRLCLAPMMDYTNQHFRAMVRLISPNILTCTEMVAADELLGDKTNCNLKQLLGQSAIIPEGPSVLQLGGNDASQLYNCAKIYHDYSQKFSNICDYTALNLNCGCPSPSVSGKRCFGAALMKDARHVTKVVRAMHDGVEGKIPVTVKCRIGVYDNNDNTPFSRQTYDRISEKKEYEKLRQFVETIASDGIVTNFQIHARIAVLGGLSPADNRRVPPLKYDYVHRLADQYPELNFVLNGGIHSLAQVEDQLDGHSSLAGVMVGRALVADPWSFSMVDELIYGDANVDKVQEQHLCTNRRELLEAYGRHADYEELHNEPAEIRRSLVAACAHLFAGEPNAQRFRMELDEISARPERLQREARAKVWSSIASGGGSTGTSILASAFAASTSAGEGWDDIQAKDSPAAATLGWDDIQAIDDNTLWDENEPPLSELILEAAHRYFGDEVLSSSRKESYDKKLWEEEEARVRIAKGDRILSIVEKSSDDKDNKVSGGVVDGWFKNGLN
jgi:tRNA-dihydrouridine synthase A